MIILTYVSPSERCVMPGDEFHLTITDPTGSQVLIRETITVAKRIDFIASFRFALEDGTCPGFHLTGVFASRAELPKELREAVRLEDLSDEQYANFARSVGIDLPERIQSPKDAT